MRAAVFASLISAAAVFAFAPQANATPSICDAIPGNLVQNCGFEGTSDASGHPIDWTFTPAAAGSAGAVTTAFPNSGDWSFGFGAADQLNDTLSQVLSTNAGAQYTVDFYYSASGGTPSDLIVKWDNTTLLTLTNEPFTLYILYSFEVTGTGSDTLSFAGFDPQDFDLLDDVSVVAHTVEGVPEPITLSLFGAGLVGAAAMCRRRKAQG
jgi:hypothetical protein